MGSTGHPSSVVGEASSADRPLHVCHVDPERGYSGGEVQVFLLIDGLLERGHRCSVITQPGSRVEAAALDRGLEVATFSMGGDWQLPSVLAIAKRLRAWQPDVVHLHTGRANWLGGWAAQRAGVCAVSTRRMDRPVRRGWKTRKIYGSFVRRTAAISPAVLECLHAGGVPPERTELIWSAVDLGRAQSKRSREAVRASLGLAPEEPMSLTSGALVPRKGIDFLLQVMADMPSATRLWVAGDGSQRAELEAQANGLGLGERVTFLGHRSDLADLLGAADIYLMPSRAEGLGVAALEAMAAGLPCLLARVGGLANLIEVAAEPGGGPRQGGAVEPQGASLDPHDGGAWKRMWADLIGDPQERKRWGASARRRIEATFLPEQMVTAYEAFYRKACPIP